MLAEITTFAPEIQLKCCKVSINLLVAQNKTEDLEIINRK